MKKHLFKSFALIAMLFSAITLSAQSGVDWSTITWTGNGSGDAAATEKYKVSPAEGLSVVNIQKPGFSDEVGIYVTAPAGISECSINSKIDGAGVVLYLSSFEFKETKVTIKHAQGTITFWVYYEDGIDWSTITWTGNGSGDAAATEKYKVSPANNLSVVNIQKPGFADEVGIYVTLPAGISDCSIGSKIDGAGVVLYLSSFVYQETKVTITYAQGTCTFWVYYADGIEGQDLGSNEEDESGWGSVNWVTGSNNKYKVSHDCLASVVSVQKPGFAEEIGIYVTTNGAIESCSVNGAIQGGGMVLYLSSFTAKETEVTINYAGGSCTFVVYYADGAELDSSAPVVTTLTATPASNLCKVGENIAIAVVAKDQNGMTMADAGTIEYTISPAEAGNIVDNVFTPTKAGLVTITASVGTVQAEPVEVYAYAGDNLALSTNIVTDNKIIAQSDVNPTIGATNAFYAVDGNDSQWQGSYTNGTADNDVARTYDAWFVVDLGAYYDLDLVSIHFEGACSQAYTIAVSKDFVNWVTAYTYNGSAGVQNRIDALYGTNLQNATDIRFVRFWSTKAATGYGMKIYDMQVYGSNRQEVTKTATKPVINSATVTSKTIEQAILSINTTSSVAIAKYRVVDNANGIDWFVSSLNPTEYVIAHLKDNTSYTLSLYAYDIDGNISDVFTMEEFKTLADNTKPTTASPTPTRDEEDVLAFYSDTYTPVINWGSKKDWNGAGTVTENAISANNYLMYKDVTWWGWTYGVKDGYTNGTLTGVDCSNMEYLHIDVWGPIDGKIRVIPIYGGGVPNNENYYAEVTIKAGQWNSVDVALADFVGAGDKHDFSSIYQIKFAELNIETVSIDNVYFWKSAGTLPVESVTLDKTTATIEVDEALQLKATVLPTDAANKNVVWTSSNTSVATVSAEGVVTGLTVGTTTITATSEDDNTKVATCAITVEPITVKTWWGGPVTLTLAGQEHYVLYSFTRNENKTITYTAIFDQGNLDIVKQVNISGVYNALEWMDADKTTASWTSTTTHNAGEKIKGFFFFGGPRINFDTEAIAYIVGSSNERPILSVESVTLDKTSCELMPTETAQLVATVNPGYVANKNVTWTSSNTAVATVDANGLVTAVAAGSATITATSVADNTKTATCTVNVMAELTGVTYHASTYVKKDANAYLGINYSITRTSNRTLRYVIKVNNSEYVDLEFNVVVDGIWKRMEYNASANTYTYTTITTYADGDVVSGFFRQIKYGTEGRWDFNYVVASTSTTPRTMVAVNDEDADLTHLNDGSVYDVILKRNFVMDGDWNTISLPFALTEEQVKEVFGEGTRITKLLSSELISSTEVDILFEEVRSIEAATPYLIKPEKNVNEGVFLENVTINTTPNILEAGITKMIPVLKTENFTGQNNTFFLGANDNLYNRSADGKIMGMRAYFQFSTLTPEQLRNVRARVVFNENVETSVDNLITDEAPTKMIQDGQLVIIRNGIKYNVQGQVIR